MVFNGTFNHISVISWWSVLLVEEIAVPGEKHRPVRRHKQTLPHNVASSEWDSNAQLKWSQVLIAQEVVNPTTIRSRPRQPQGAVQHQNICHKSVETNDTYIFFTSMHLQNIQIYRLYPFIYSGVKHYKPNHPSIYTMFIYVVCIYIYNLFILLGRNHLIVT